MINNWPLSWLKSHSIDEGMIGRRIVLHTITTFILSTKQDLTCQCFESSRELTLLPIEKLISTNHQMKNGFCFFLWQEQYDALPLCAKDDKRGSRSPSQELWAPLPLMIRHTRCTYWTAFTFLHEGTFEEMKSMRGGTPTQTKLLWVSSFNSGCRWDSFASTGWFWCSLQIAHAANKKYVKKKEENINSVHHEPKSRPAIDNFATLKKMPKAFVQWKICGELRSLILFHRPCFCSWTNNRWMTFIVNLEEILTRQYCTQRKQQPWSANKPRTLKD